MMPHATHSNLIMLATCLLRLCKQYCMHSRGAQHYLNMFARIVQTALHAHQRSPPLLEPACKLRCTRMWHTMVSCCERSFTALLVAYRIRLLQPH
ncbi:hypothetical protein COO60DRAFT_794874 [Scenedesmus sp. NREL 46B-D3]|nr:hypothetical protein COO60DRAFT_794874 [Scenedesmus sp. NREL 46B-D3]